MNIQYTEEAKLSLLSDLYVCMTEDDIEKARTTLNEINSLFMGVCDYVTEKVAAVESFLDGDLNEGPDRSYMELKDAISSYLDRIKK